MFATTNRELNLSIVDEYVEHLQKEKLEGIYGENGQL